MRCFAPSPISNLKIFLLLLAISLFGQNKIILKHEAPFRKDLLLKNVAFITTPNKNLKRFLEHIAIDEKYIADSLFSKDDLLHLLKKNMIDPKAFLIQGEKTALYHRAKTIRKETLLGAIRDYIAAKYPNLKIQRVYLSFRPISLQKGRYTISIQLSSQTFSHLYLLMQIRSDGEVIATIRPTVAIVRYGDLPFAARDIPKGKLIDESDFVLKRERLRSFASHILHPNQLIGQVAKRTIKAGQLIREYMVEPNYAVKKRKQVKVVYQKGAIRIELLGLALENGRVGDIIRVKNLSSNKVLRCKVLSRGIVRYLY